LVKYFLKDYLDEDKKFIEKVRDNTLDKTLRKVSENKLLGIHQNKSQMNINSYNNNINSMHNVKNYNCHSE